MAATQRRVSSAGTIAASGPSLKRLDKVIVQLTSASEIDAARDLIERSGLAFEEGTRTRPYMPHKVDSGAAQIPSPKGIVSLPS